MKTFFDKFISSKKNIFGFVLTFLVLLAIPITVFTTLNLRQNSPKAESPNSKTMTPAQVAGMIGDIDEEEVEFEYSFSYNKDTGKATLESVKLVPHGLDPTTTTAAGEVPFNISFTDIEGKKQIKKNVLKTNNSKFKVKTGYIKDGYLEITDNLGVKVFKDDVKNLPKAEGIPAQMLYQKMEGKK